MDLSIRKSVVRRKDLCVGHMIIILGKVVEVAQIIWDGFLMYAKCKDGREFLEIQFYWYSQIEVVR